MPNIIRWSPMFPDFFEDMMGDTSGRAFTPAIDVYQTEKSVVVEMPLPDIDINNVDIEVTNDMLTVSGKSEHKSEVDEKNYYRREVRHGSFTRSVMLPAHIDADNTEASYEKGVLKINLPKKELSSGKKIKIANKE